MTTLLFLNLSTSMVWGLIVGCIIVILFLFFVFCYYVLAPKNVLFTFGRENKATYVMVGKKFSGKVILPSKTLYVNTDETDSEHKMYDIKNFENDPFRSSTELKKRFARFNIFGMYWVGIPPFYSIYERRQQWLEWKSLEGGKRTIILRDEMTPYLITKPFEYAMMLEEAEDKDGMPLNLFFTVTLKPTNAVLPMFGNDNAYGQVQTKCLSEVLLFTKTKTFTTLGGDNKTPNVANDEFSLLLCKLNETIPGNVTGDGITKILGYMIDDAKLDKVEIAGKNKDLLIDASTYEYVAKEKKKAMIAEAEGRLESTRLDAQGETAKLKVQSDYLKDLSTIPGAMDVEKRKATPGLTTLVEDKEKTSLIIGGR